MNILLNKHVSICVVLKYKFMHHELCVRPGTWFESELKAKWLACLEGSNDWRIVKDLAELGLRLRI